MYASQPESAPLDHGDHVDRSGDRAREPDSQAHQPSVSSGPQKKQRTTARRADFSDLAAKTQEREVNDIFY
jgi:hypothetical protein